MPNNNKKESQEKSLFSSEIIDDAGTYVKKFHRKFRNQIVVSISAAFGFLIALSWREPISQLIDNIIDFANLHGSEIYIQILSAMIITIIAVLGIMLVSRWEIKKEEQENK